MNEESKSRREQQIENKLKEAMSRKRRTRERKKKLSPQKILNSSGKKRLMKILLKMCERCLFDFLPP